MIADLLSRGLTNPMIAERLYLSTKIVTEGPSPGAGASCGSHSRCQRPLTEVLVVAQAVQALTLPCQSR